MIRRFPLSVFLIVIAAGPFFSCAAPTAHRNPTSIDGVLDLRDWDFASDGPVRLRGEWGFFWKELIDPNLKHVAPAYADVPSYWNRFDFGSGTIGPIGYASYSLTVILPSDAPRMAVKVRDIQTAYALFINGENLLSAGIVGQDGSEGVPRYASQVKDFSGEDPVLHVVVHVSNFHHRNGGMWELIELGPEETIRRADSKAAEADFFIIGIITAMGLYHILRFVLKRTDKMSVDFGGFCLLIAIRSTIVGELHAYQLLPEVPWGVLHRIEYLAFATALPTFLSYIRSLFPGTFINRAVRWVWGAGLLFALIVVATPPNFYGRFLMGYQIVTIASGVLIVATLIRAWKEGRNGSRFLLAGFAILFLLVLNDILYTNQMIHTGHWMEWGLLVFMVSQSYLIARISSDNSSIVERQNSLLTETRLGVIVGLAKLAEYRDEDTGIHLERIREYCRLLAEALAKQPRYSGYISDAYIDDLYHSSILHDIGKVGVPDAVLLKPGRLTNEEFESIKMHPRLGGDTISDVEQGLSDRTFLTLGKEIAYSHHEKWNGTGYPAGLEGEEIPLSARIVALADVYDALTSKRPYKEAFSHTEARKIILDGRGVHFDPDIVDAFLAREVEIEQLKRKLVD